MDKESLAESIGKEIISRIYRHSEIHTLDDAEYIPIVKRVIEAIKLFLEKSKNDEIEIDSIEDSLISFLRKLYVETCQKNAKEDNEDISVEEVKEESKEYFNYIYENEEHPY